MFLDRVRDSPSLELVNLVLEMRAKGRKVVSLAIGDPSFDTPEEIVEAAHRSMEEGETHYVHSYGTMDVREAIVKKAARKNGIRAAIENTIFMATKMSVYVALAAISSGPFEALIPDPGYFYSEPILLAGGKPVYYPLSKGFGIDLEGVRKKMGSKTRAIILNTPSNPTGRVAGREELAELYEYCSEKGIAIISDEPYEDLTYGKAHVSIGSFEERPERVISLYSLSKSYSMTGWRAGYVVGPKAVVAAMNKFVENALTCFPPFIQHASAYALENGDGFIADFKKQYVKRRKLLEDRMGEIPQLSGREIEGAFYAFPKYEMRMGSQELCRKLLSSQNVALLPGAVFGPSGEKHLRISFAPSEEAISLGMDGLKRFFAENA